jgi:hypothetical protein
MAVAKLRLLLMDMQSFVLISFVNLVYACNAKVLSLTSVQACLSPSARFAGARDRIHDALLIGHQVTPGRV